MQRARCGVAAARLHRQLQHPPPFTLGFSLVAVLPLACLTSRPAALRDAPRSFTFKIIRNHCKNSLCNKNISSFAAVAIGLKAERFLKLSIKIKCLLKLWMHSSLHVPRASLWEPRTGGHVDVARCRHICLGHQLAKLIGNYFRVQCSSSIFFVQWLCLIVLSIFLNPLCSFQLDSFWKFRRAPAGSYRVQCSCSLNLLQFCIHQSFMRGKFLVVVFRYKRTVNVF